MLYCPHLILSLRVPLRAIKVLRRAQCPVQTLQSGLGILHMADIILLDPVQRGGRIATAATRPTRTVEWKLGESLRVAGNTGRGTTTQGAGPLESTREVAAGGGLGRGQVSGEVHLLIVVRRVDVLDYRLGSRSELLV